MTANKEFREITESYINGFHPVVPFDTAKDKLLALDFTEQNKELHPELLNDTRSFSTYISNKLRTAGATYGIGGYAEHRTIYSRSELFGPSPTTGTHVQEDAKAPSRWEGEEGSDLLVEEETVGYRYADPMLYDMLRNYALEHRSMPTQTEEVLWKVLKTKRLNEYKFRRQHIIDCFIADFVCLKKKLVIEVDGLIHQLPGNKENDEQRTKRLNALGFKVIRFRNEEVVNDLEHVSQLIVETLEAIKIEQEPPLTPATAHITNTGTPTAHIYKTEINTPHSISEERSVDGPSHREGSGMGHTEPRRLHLGIDIWGKIFTKIMAPLDGIVHSFAFNNGFGNYGATLILTHNIEGFTFHTLYGHLSLNSLKNFYEGQNVRKGDVIAEFGPPAENGQWPPHLHFQIILNMEGMKGDYPGVCAFSEREKYLANCPDPDGILQMNQYIDNASNVKKNSTATNG